MDRKLLALIVAACLATAWLVATDERVPPRARALVRSADKLRRLHTALDAPKGSEWLAVFDEPGQILAGYVIDNLLIPALPDDAAAMIALTTVDL